MIYVILTFHWLADFVFQTDKMAKNKSRSFYWLFVHVMTYCAVISVPIMWEYSLFSGRNFILINVISHFAIDAITSRVSSFLWSKNQVHNFFVVIGLDQLLHTAILYWSYSKFLNN
jgi:hypothetical protein